MPRYRVSEGTQVRHGEKLYGPGETIEASEQEAREWIARGYVVEAKAKPRKR